MGIPVSIVGPHAAAVLSPSAVDPGLRVMHGPRAGPGRTVAVTGVIALLLVGLFSPERHADHTAAVPETALHHAVLVADVLQVAAALHLVAQSVGRLAELPVLVDTDVLVGTEPSAAGPDVAADLMVAAGQAFVVHRAVVRQWLLVAVMLVLASVAKSGKSKITFSRGDISRNEIVYEDRLAAKTERKP